MASIVLHNSAGIVANRASVTRCEKGKPLNSVLDFKPKFNEQAVRSNFFPRSLGMSQRGGRSRTAMKSVRQEATAEGGVTVVENEASLERCMQEAGDKLVVLDISTRTCGPCKIIYPKVVRMSKEYPDAVFLKINGDLNSDTRALMRKWGVRGVPNFRFFRNGKLIHSHTGANEDELRGYFLTHFMAKAQL